MRRSTQAVIGVVIAYAVVVILISPAVPSLPTTAPTKYTLQPPHGILHIVAIAWATAAHDSCLIPESVLERPAHPTASGSTVDVITALRC